MTKNLAAGLLLVFLSTPGSALTLSFSGAVQSSGTSFDGRSFQGQVFIDLSKPARVVGNTQGFAFIPEGFFELQLGSTFLRERVFSVSPLAGRGGGPSFLRITATPLRPADVFSTSLQFFPGPGSDPFSGAPLDASLEAIAGGCCSAELSVNPLRQPEFTTPATVAAIPEPAASGAFLAGLCLIASRTGHRRACRQV